MLSRVRVQDLIQDVRAVAWRAGCNSVLAVKHGEDDLNVFRQLVSNLMYLECGRLVHILRPVFCTCASIPAHTTSG